MTKTFLSIGSGPGIGLATARRFAREGYRIVLSARNAKRLGESVAVLEALGADVDACTVDATDPVAVAKLVADVGPSLQVLHYNTGVLHYDRDANLLTRTIDDESFESLQSDMQINIGSCLAAIKAALPALRGHIPGTSSILLTGGGLGVNPSGNFLALSIGKAAIRAAAQALFEPLRDEGIHVATVTVSRLVSPNSEPSNAIAEEFWKLHAQPRSAWAFETVVS